MEDYNSNYKSSTDRKTMISIETATPEQLRELKSQESELAQYKKEYTKKVVNLRLETNTLRKAEAYCALNGVKLSEVVKAYVENLATQASTALSNVNKEQMMLEKKAVLDTVKMLDEVSGSNSFE